MTIRDASPNPVFSIRGCIDDQVKDHSGETGGSCFSVHKNATAGPVCDIISLMEITTEYLGRKDLIFHQQKDGFRFGTDSVLLAWFASSFVRGDAKRTYRMLELGSNCGAVSILCAGRRENVLIDALEIMPGPCEVMRMNIKENSLSDRVRVFEHDIRDTAGMPREVKDLQYNVVMFNPPFYRESTGPSSSRKGGGGTRLAGRFEENGGLRDFLAAASSRVVQSSGYIVFIMHSQRLAESFALMKDLAIKPTHLCAVHPFEDREASMFLMAGRKGSSGTDMKILPPLILNSRTPDGDIIVNDRIKKIYEEEHTDCFI